MEKVNQRKLNSSIELVIFLLGIFIFTYFSQQSGLTFSGSIAGLFLSTAVIAFRVKNFRDFLNIFGIHKIQGNNLYYLPLAVISAVFFSLFYRHFLNLGLIPLKITVFTGVVAMIGATEELIFRGYIQTQSRTFGIPFSILTAALSHTLYKYLLFMTLYFIHPVNMDFLFIWTFLIGLILGIMREYSGSCWIPIIFHSVFDIIVYGDKMIDTWWVFV